MPSKQKIPQFSSTVGGIRQISNDDLTLRVLPGPNAPMKTIMAFAYTYDYFACRQSADKRAFAKELRERFTRTRRIDASLSDLRLALFVEARRFSHSGDLDCKDAEFSRALVAAMRKKISAQQRGLFDDTHLSACEEDRYEKLRPALDRCADLARSKHSFLLNVCGPRELVANQACILQAVDRNRLFQDGDFGLCLYLVFETNDADALARFRLLADFVAAVSVDCDPDLKCYALNFGVDVTAALRTISLVLVQVYGYSVDDEFEAMVFDEGQSEIDAVVSYDPDHVFDFVPEPKSARRAKPGPKTKLAKAKDGRLSH